MREYNISFKQVDQSVLWSIYDYGHKAFSVYATALYQWLEQNLASSLARDSIQDMVTNYPDKEKKLKRYLERALKPPEDRSTASYPKSHSSHTSAVSAHSMAIIRELRIESTLLKKERKEMEFTLEEKELDVKQRVTEQELQGKKNELGLRKMQAEVDVCKSVRKGADSIVEASDFNYELHSYKNLQVSSENLLKP